MCALQSQSDCCVHNLDDQMNLEVQGSLNRSSARALGYDVERPGFNPRLCQWNSFKFTNSLFISKEIGDDCISLSPHE